MKKNNVVFFFTTMVFTMLLFNAQTAYAYLDPGAGSILLQGVMGAIAAVFVGLRLYWHRVLQLLGFKKKIEKKEDIK
ncbi:MAG: hypothetical protein NTW08_10325 [Gammaproteobacteria bacterium]|nr:hypothetical protein [Gammaproteobacteria bacterium]